MESSVNSKAAALSQKETGELIKGKTPEESGKLLSEESAMKTGEGGAEEIQEDPVDAVAKSTRLFRLLHGFLRLLLWLFFREIEVVGLENIPKDRGGVVVSWHPNGLIDGGLIIVTPPRRIVFGARHGLFRWPLLGALMRNVGTVPIRTGEGSAASERRKANVRSLNHLANAVADGRLTALFPEGISHDASHLMEIKTGAARLYYQARQMQGDDKEPPVIIPVGLHYDQKRIFRSRALVRYHPPIKLPPELDVKPDPEESEETSLNRVRKLTSEIGRVLQDVVLATEDWRTHRLISRARTLMRAESASRHGRDPGPIRFSDMSKGFARIRAGYLARKQTDPEAVDRLTERLEKYDSEMVKLGLEDVDLDRSPSLYTPWFSLVIQLFLVFLLMPPLLLWGYIVNGPTALILLLIAKIAGKTDSDEATLKVLCGAVLFPATWVGVGFLAGMGYIELREEFPHLSNTAVFHGILVAFLSIIGGMLALRWLHLAQETMRAVRVRIVRARRRDVLEKLREERAVIHNGLLELRRGLDLRRTLLMDAGRTNLNR